MDEQQISKSEPVCLRYHESRYLYEKFIQSCGPPNDSYFLMITYFDAFLFSYVSIEEMTNQTVKKQLNDLDVFKFLKAARNLTTHHSVLAAPKQQGGFERPFSRIINESNTSITSAKLRIRIEKFRQIFALAAQKFPRGGRVFNGSEDYLQRIEKTGADNVFIDAIMLEGLEGIAKILDCDA
jgi:hypothetical protein